MQKCKALMAISLSFMLLGLPALGEMTAASGSMETDAELFAVCCDVAGYTPPVGYALEGFQRGDLNADDITDVVISLASQAEGRRILVVVMSGERGYSVIENAAALPPVNAENGETFTGVTVDTDCIAIHTAEGGVYRQYLFTREGDRFHLSEMAALQWDASSGEATQERFDYAQGEYTLSHGAVAAEDGYVFAALDAQRRFDGASPALDAFDMTAFPKTWEALQGIVAVADGPASATVCETCGETLSPEAAQTHDCPEAEAVTTVFCHACEKSFPEGEAFRSHECIPQQTAARCTVCGVSFETQEALNAHVCKPGPTPGTVQCGVCGGWFEEGNAFRNHVCISTAPAQIYCDVCGGRYDEGDAFRNHMCPPQQQQAPPASPAPGG